MRASSPARRFALLLASLVGPIGGCSDYAIEGKTDPPSGLEDTGGSPDVLVDPVAVDLGVVCGGAGAGTVNVSNVGGANLNILGATIAGTNWVVGDATFPATLAPGETLAIPVSGGPGDAVLTVVTDDPDSPEVTVPLSATADAPPTATLVDPADGTVYAGDVTEYLTGLVSDDVDPPESLSVVWTSSVDGLLAALPPDSSGTTTAPWEPTAHTPGSHFITLDVTDSCGQTAQSSVSLCQDQGYTADNLDLSTWHFEGSAQWDAGNSWVQLTDTSIGQSGTAFQTGATVGADNVSIAFRFYVSGGTGADGLSVTALDTTRMTSFVGQSGGGLGYMGLPGWSIEVDTYYNGDLGDPTAEDHVSIHFDGAPYTPAVWAALPDMEDGAWHDMEINVLAPHVTVSVDGTVYVDTDLAGFTAFPAYVGFTASTGALTNYHLVDALTVTRYVCEDG